MSEWRRYPFAAAGPVSVGTNLALGGANLIGAFALPREWQIVVVLATVVAGHNLVLAWGERRYRAVDPYVPSRRHIWIVSGGMLALGLGFLVFRYPLGVFGAGAAAVILVAESSARLEWHLRAKPAPPPSRTLRRRPPHWAGY